MAQESVNSPVPAPKYRWTFNSDWQSAQDGWSNTGVTFVNGVAQFNGSSYLNSTKVTIPSGIYSVRIKCNTTNFAALRFLIDFRGTLSTGNGFIAISNTTGILIPDSGTAYVNGVASLQLVASANMDIVVTGMTLKTGTTLGNVIGADYNANSKFLGSIDLVEIYTENLTAASISNLYRNSRFVPLSPHGEILGTELCGDPTFDTDLWWVHTDPSISVSGGYGRFVSSPAYSALSKGSILTQNKIYKVTYTLSSFTGSFHLYAGGVAGIDRLAAGTYTEYIIPTTNGNFYLQVTDVSTLLIDNVSIREVISTAIPILDVHCTRGFVESRVSPLTSVTGVAVRNGRMIANGVSSKIDCGTVDMTGDRTIVFFGRLNGYGKGSSGRILDNGKLIIFPIRANARIGVISDGSSAVYSATNSILLGINYMIAFTRKSDGKASIYIGTLSTSLALSGTADQNSGTPTSGTTNLILLNDSASTSAYDGPCGFIRIYSGILSLDELEQLRTSNANKYL